MQHCQKKQVECGKTWSIPLGKVIEKLIWQCLRFCGKICIYVRQWIYIEIDLIYISTTTNGTAYYVMFKYVHAMNILCIRREYVFILYNVPVMRYREIVGRSGKASCIVHISVWMNVCVGILIHIYNSISHPPLN